MLKRQALGIFEVAIERVKSENLIQKNLIIEDNKLLIHNQVFDLTTFKNIYVIGAGKASAYMARSIENKMGDYITSGNVIVKYGHTADCSKIVIEEAGHPVPDQNSIKATQHILNLLSQAGQNDLVIVLLSGGGSALMEALPQGISLSDIQSLNNLLIACGADINEINTIRKHVSLVKGGQLAQYIYPASGITLIISDVPGDHLPSIASGPTAADNSSFRDALMVIAKYNLTGKISLSIMNYLQSGVNGKVPETLKHGNPALDKIHHFIIGNIKSALQAAKEKAESLGYSIALIESGMQGEAQNAATYIAKKMATLYQKEKAQCLLLGGETTVTIKGQGKGGRNQELALAALQALKNYNQPYALLSCGTDGTDGPTDAAGAIIDNKTWLLADSKKLNPQKYLNENDSYHFFKKMGGLIKTGPTGTNVMDIVIVLMN